MVAELAVRPDEYLTVAELADRLKVAVKTVRNHMHDGTWQKGLHWFSPPGFRPRFSWSAIERWLRGEEAATPPCPLGGPIPLARVAGRRRCRTDSNGAEQIGQRASERSG